MTQSILVLDREDVATLLPMAECVDLMAEALSALADGWAEVPLRTAMWLPQRHGLLGMMPGYLLTKKVMGLKAVSVMPGNHGTELDAHQGGVLLFETERGRPLALVDASEITALRTAAVSGVATRLLARRRATDLAILGTGVQAATHLEAMFCVRAIGRVRVWSRTPEHVREFAERASVRHGIEVEPILSARDAVEGADIVCTTTSANEPILEGDWIEPGAHINAVGSSVPVAREVDAAVLARSRIFVDRRESALAEAGDLLLAHLDGDQVPDSDQIPDGDQIAGWIQGELGELLTGRVAGRTSEDEITLFESLGLGVEDVAAAYAVYEKARKNGMGTPVSLGGKRPSH